MKPAFLTLITLLLGPLDLHAVELATSAKPNILVIVADDLGYGDLGVHGGKDVPTPHLDALAARVLRCTIVYFSAPYCSPTQAGLLTLILKTRFGHEFNPHVVKEG